MNNLKSSAADRKRCKALSEAARDDYPEDEIAVKRLMGRFERRDVLTYADMRLALTGDGDAHRSFLSLYEAVSASDPCVKISSLDITGNDVMELTGARGAEVGKLLSELLDAVICGRIENRRDAIEAYLLRG
jgi:hypothetical protein